MVLLGTQSDEPAGNPSSSRVTRLSDQPRHLAAKPGTTSLTPALPLSLEKMRSRVSPKTSFSCNARNQSVWLSRSAKQRTVAQGQACASLPCLGEQQDEHSSKAGDSFDFETRTSTGRLGTAAITTAFPQHSTFARTSRYSPRAKQVWAPSPRDPWSHHQSAAGHPAERGLAARPGSSSSAPGSIADVLSYPCLPGLAESSEGKLTGTMAGGISPAQRPFVGVQSVA
ncbi:hypothetical protein B0T11DRAFT_279283 [Plectosphaerella cucumerina]|uniref:Uncharacterized protein n=1 Tax=Plectosphaerella cucumerina TaxID=40658 RepID=A0A8K0TBI3_9PEZI|nr:hypothetical protein B0T11DRAFT_279283 [Plectosphaerella cucumerina]